MVTAVSLGVLVTQLCPTLCDPMDCSLPGSSVHGILQERILEWVVIPFSRGFLWPRDRTQVFHIAGRFFTIWATREAQSLKKKKKKKKNKKTNFAKGEDWRAPRWVNSPGAGRWCLERLRKRRNSFSFIREQSSALPPSILLVIFSFLCGSTFHAQSVSHIQLFTTPWTVAQ